MAIVLKPLKQVRITETDAVGIYTPGANEEAVFSVRVANTSASGCTLILYQDIDGSTWNDATTILPQITIPAYQVFTSGGEMPYIMNSNAGSFAAKAGTEDALTITISGFIRT